MKELITVYLYQIQVKGCWIDTDIQGSTEDEVSANSNKVDDYMLLSRSAKRLIKRETTIKETVLHF